MATSSTAAPATSTQTTVMSSKARASFRDASPLHGIPGRVCCHLKCVIDDRRCLNWLSCLAPVVNVACLWQFLDTVWQLLVQFPRVFQFSPRMLLVLADHVYSCRFGTFLFNCEREQNAERLELTTPSLWGHIRAIAPSLTNPLYDPTVGRNPLPSTLSAHTFTSPRAFTTAVVDIRQSGGSQALLEHCGQESLIVAFVSMDSHRWII